MATRHFVAATLLLLACLAPACRAPESDPVSSIDLAAGLGGADIVTRTNRINPGAYVDRRHLLPRWKIKIVQGEEIGVGIGEQSSLWFFSPASRDVYVQLHGHSRPWVQTVSVLVNGEPVGTIDTVEGSTVYQVGVPAEVVRPGRNVMTLEYGSYDRNQPYRRDLAAMYWYLFEFEWDRPTATVLPRVTADSLFVPFGTRVEYFLELPTAASVELGDLQFVGGSGQLKVEVEEDGVGITTLATLGEDSGPGEPIVIENASGSSEDAAGRVIALALEATSEATVGDLRSGVLLSAPRVILAPEAAAETRQPKAPSVTEGDRNVLLYVIDTLRADHVGAYGYGRDVSPHIDRFASDATLFANAQSQASWTRASMASIFTGLWPGRHGAIGRKDKLSVDAQTLAEVLQAAGYATGGFSANPMVAPVFGFDQGFDVHNTTEETDPQVLIPMLAAWLDGPESSDPFFAWVHALGPHDPYTPPAEHQERFLDHEQAVAGLEQPPQGREKSMRSYTESEQRAAALRWLDLYDGEVAQHDEAFQEVLRALETRDLLDSTLVILVSDHGEEFLEHGNIRHSTSLFAELVRVPLVIRFPDRGRGVRVEPVVDHVDLMPTILEWVGVAAPAGIEGRSLLPLTEGRPEPHKLYSFQHQQLDNRFYLGVTNGRWKLIQDRSYRDEGVNRTQLFDLENDTAELVNVARFYPVRTRFLERLLEARLLERPEWETIEAELDEETEDALRALGYLQ